MLLLPIAVGWLAVAAGPEPSGPTADRALARVALLAGRELPGDAPTGVETAEYVVESAPRATLVFLLPPGPRTVRAIEVLPTPKTAAAWPSARFRLNWEVDDPDPAKAAVDLPLGLAFGRATGVPAIESRPVGSSGDAWVNRFPMPYRTQALLRIDTPSPLVGRIRVRSTRGADPDAGYFKAALWMSPKRLSETGRGHLAGLILTSEGTGPQSGGRLVVDEKPAASLLTVFGRERSAASHWRIDDPIAYHRSFAVEAGTDSNAAGSAAAVFWYSDHPGPVRLGASD